MKYTLPLVKHLNSAIKTKLLNKIAIYNMKVSINKKKKI